ncbi:hypothetical protein J1N35_007906 [Gossypium stocksii]|uniref:Uncharacterized protein n=1 Tax=Gossypium stocksii TaxID=47602 RepID=A0A9D3W9E1_9ROSI|nr:hypothetical protein J1N35_007906 [Gossypium stocksii]
MDQNREESREIDPGRILMLQCRYIASVEPYRHQTGVFFCGHIGYKWTDNLLLSKETDKGTSNPLIEGDNDGVDAKNDTIDKERTGGEEGDRVAKVKWAVDAVDKEESDPKPIWFNDDASDNAPDPDTLFRAYEHLIHKMNIDMLTDSGSKFSRLL